MPECYSSGLLQEISGNIWREWVGGSIVLQYALFQALQKGYAAVSKA